MEATPSGNGKYSNKETIPNEETCTKLGANRKILQQVYKGYVRPVKEYGSAAWAIAAKSNTSRLTKIQNSSVRLITGGLKSTPINALESTTQLQPLDQSKEEKVLTQHEKIQRLPQHPVHNILQKPCSGYWFTITTKHLEPWG